MACGYGRATDELVQKADDVAWSGDVTDVRIWKR